MVFRRTQGSTSFEVESDEHIFRGLRAASVRYLSEDWEKLEELARMLTGLDRSSESDDLRDLSNQIRFWDRRAGWRNSSRCLDVPKEQVVS